MKKTKEKAISLRLSVDLYEKIVNKAIEQSKSEKKMVHISEIIRKTLEDNV